MDEPEITKYDYFYLRAFNRLSTEREIGMGMGPIPWSKRKEYGRDFGLDSTMVDTFAEIIGLLDVEYLNWNADQQKKRREMNKPPSSKTRK